MKYSLTLKYAFLSIQNACITDVHQKMASNKMHKNSLGKFDGLIKNM